MLKIWPGTMKCVPFSDVPVGAEFWWGGYTADTHNWGKKRSSRTAVYRVRLNGKFSSHEDWAYWGQNEIVYVQY